MFGLSAFEIVQVLIWAGTGIAIIVTQVTNVRWLRSDVSNLGDLIAGIHSRLDRRDAKIDAEFAALHERVSITREALARQEAVCASRRLTQ